MDRLKRALPQPPGLRQLQPRDRLVVLPLVGRCGPVSSGQIRRFAGFPSASTCARRLRVLRDLKLVHVHTPFGPSGENLYTLSTLGLAEIERLVEGSLALEGMRARRGLPGDLDHHLAVVDAFVDASVAAARSNRIRLTRTVLDWEFRAAGASRSALVPDLLLVLEGPAGARAFAVEVDRGTISPHKVAQKALGYAKLARARVGLAGVADWTVLVVVPTKRRMNRLAERLLDEPLPEGFWHYGIAGEVGDRTFFTKAWHTVVATGAETAGFELVNPFGERGQTDLPTGSSLGAAGAQAGAAGSTTVRGPS